MTCAARITYAQNLYRYINKFGPSSLTMGTLKTVNILMINFFNFHSFAFYTAIIIYT